LNKFYDRNNWEKIDGYFYYKSTRIPNNNVILSFLNYLNDKNYIPKDLYSIYKKENKNQKHLLEILQEQQCKTYFYCFKQETWIEGILKINLKDIQQMIVIFPWAKTILSRAFFSHVSCIMHDATFYSCHPYTASIGLSIINDISIPLYLSIGPSEKSLLFTRAYDCLVEYGIDKDILIQIPVLSDRGPAIKKFVEEWDIQRQYFCHRHIIEHFGSNSPIAFMISDLLRIIDPISFERQYKTLRDIIADPNQIYGITQEQREKFCSCFNIENFNSYNDVIFMNEVSQIALFARMGIPKTTNHIESLHSKLNARIRSNLKIENKLKNVINHLIKISLRVLFPSDDKDKEYINRSFFETLTVIENHMKPLNDDRYEYYCEYDNGERFYKCPVNCRQDYYYTNLFNAEFPCIHTYKINKRSFTIKPGKIPFDYTKPNINNIFEMRETEFDWDFSTKQSISKNDISFLDRIKINALSSINVKDEIFESVQGYVIRFFKSLNFGKRGVDIQYFIDDFLNKNMNHIEEIKEDFLKSEIHKLILIYLNSLNNS